MVYKPVVLDKSQVKSLNTQLTNLQKLHEDICKAESANVPGLEAHKQQCEDLRARIILLKQKFAPMEP